jgi:segregation and condensation protein A
MSPLYPIQLPVFKGPLDLLLRLIEQEELDITTVALAQVTDQYLAHLAELERRQVKELADFLTVAAKLLLIKSTMLLPRPSAPSPEAEVQDAGEELVRQLQIYKRFKDIATLLHQREELGFHSYVRVAPPPDRDPQLDLGDVTLHDLLAVAQEALDALPGPPIGEVVAPIVVTIGEQIDRIEYRLTRQHQVRFHEILSAATTRIEIIVTLLALLELIKQDRVQARQEYLFSEIIIERRVADEPVLADANPET